MKSPAYRSAADRVGIAASGVCAVHCLFVPVALALFPGVMARLFASPLTHHVLAGVVVCTSLAAFIPGWLKHGEARVWGWALAGLGCVLAARFEAEGAAEIVFTAVGSVLLIIAHRLNHSLSYWADPE